MSWICKCGLINSGLNHTCAAKSSTILGNEHYQISRNKPDYIQTIVARKELNIVNPQEELFAKFYNQQKVLVKDMDTQTLREHRELLSQIALEAKAKLVATDDETRERTAKTKNKDWLVTADTTSQNSSDALAAVKQRAARMSKMDRLRMQLITAGIDEDTVKEMVSNMERKATEKSIKTVTFEKKTTEIAVVNVDKVKDDKPSEPFNPSSLKFGS